MGSCPVLFSLPPGRSVPPVDAMTVMRLDDWIAIGMGAVLAVVFGGIALERLLKGPR